MRNTRSTELRPESRNLRSLRQIAGFLPPYCGRLILACFRLSTTNPLNSVVEACIALRT